MTYFVVTMEHGAAWDDGRGIREQAGWDAHADFMDALVDEGFVVLGGPLGDGHRALLVVQAPDEGAVRKRLALDPWVPMRVLSIGMLEPWTIWLDGREPRPAQGAGTGSRRGRLRAPLRTGTAPRPDAPVKSAWPPA
jgi:hypothetical protein